MYRIDRDFNEVEYLCDTAKTKYAVYNMVLHANLLKPSSEEKYLAEHNDINDIPDTTIRLDKEGTLAISFSGKVPTKILTSYGAMKIHHGQINSLVSTSAEAKFWETLQNTFGLEPIPNHSNVMAVTKLPWREVGQSLPNLATPSAVLDTSTTNSAEQSHLQKVCKVVNATFIHSRHPEFMLRGVDDICKINGTLCSLAQALETYPSLLPAMQRALREDYARLHPTVPTFEHEM